MNPPDKVWTHDLTSPHTHDHFHSTLWKPLKTRRLAWYKSLSGLQTRFGYSHYATYWNDNVPPAPCPHCGHRHNLSVHGYLANCSPTHPLVQASLTAWPDQYVPRTWRATAIRRDLRIVGRLAVPVSLFRALCSPHGGPRAVRKVGHKWQQAVLDSVTAVLSESIPAPPSKPNPFTPSDWHMSSRPV